MNLFFSLPVCIVHERHAYFPALSGEIMLEMARTNLLHTRIRDVLTRNGFLVLHTLSPVREEREHVK